MSPVSGKKKTPRAPSTRHLAPPPPPTEEPGSVVLARAAVKEWILSLRPGTVSLDERAALEMRIADLLAEKDREVNWRDDQIAAACATAERLSYDLADARRAIAAAAAAFKRGRK